MASKRKTWRLRTGDSTVVEVSAAPDATRTQIRRRSRWALVVGMLMAILAVGAVMASADTITPDGDTLTAGDQATVNLGTVSPGATLTLKTSFTLTCTGKDHPDSGQTISLTHSSGSSTIPSGGSLTATSASIGAIPASWPDDTSGGGSTNCPSPLTLGDNGDSTVTITAPTAPGTYNYVVWWGFGLSPAGSGDSNALIGNHVSVTYTLTVAAPVNSPPQVSVTGVTGGASYEIGSVPAATCQVTDAEDGPSSFAATLSAISGPLSAYGLGEQTASCSYTDAGGLTASASVTYSIVDTTKPVITFVSRTPAANANGWNNGDVTVTWSCSDSGSGVVAASVSQTVSTEGANQSATGTCTDHAGNTASDTQTGINIDKTAPTITYIGQSPAANSDGWNNRTVTLSWSCSDALSGTPSGGDTVTQSITTEGTNQTATGTCYDNAGNSAQHTDGSVNIDETAPSITFFGQSPAKNTYGWNNSTVTLSWTCSDTLSGIPTGGSPVTQQISTEGSGQQATGTCYDKAGNSSSSTDGDVNIDKTAPSLNILGDASGSYGVCGSSPVRPTFSPTDALSGIASQSDTWTTPSNPSGVGTYTYSATATDKAGNTTSETRTYSVTYDAAFSGYLQPINADGSSRFKLGSTVPVKFQLMCGTTPITNAVVKLYVAQGDSAPDPGTDEAISTSAATTGNLFRYDSTAQQYIFNLSTKLGYMNPGSSTPISFSQGTWTLKILLDDGTWHSINIQLPK